MGLAVDVFMNEKYRLPGFLKVFSINPLAFYDPGSISQCSTIHLDDISTLNLSLISGLEKMSPVFQMMRMSDRNELKMSDDNRKVKEGSQALWSGTSDDVM